MCVYLSSQALSAAGQPGMGTARTTLITEKCGTLYNCAKEMRTIFQRKHHYDGVYTKCVIITFKCSTNIKVNRHIYRKVNFSVR